MPSVALLLPAWGGCSVAGPSWASCRAPEAGRAHAGSTVHPTISMQAEIYKPMSAKYRSAPTLLAGDSSACGTPKRSCRSGASSPGQEEDGHKRGASSPAMWRKEVLRRQAARPQSSGGSPKSAKGAASEEEALPAQAPAAEEPGGADEGVWLVPSFLPHLQGKTLPLEEVAALLATEAAPSITVPEFSPPAAGTAAPVQAPQPSTIGGTAASTPTSAHTAPEKRRLGQRMEPEPIQPQMVKRNLGASASQARHKTVPRTSLRSPSNTLSRTSSAQAAGFRSRGSLKTSPSHGGPKGLANSMFTSGHRASNQGLLFQEIDFQRPPSPPPPDLTQIAKELNIPFGIAKQAADMFKLHVAPRRPGFDALRDGRLTTAQFHKVFGAIHRVGQQTNEDALREADAYGDGLIDFKEFAFWYFCGGFSEQCMLTEEERKLRGIARLCNLTFEQVDRYRQQFEIHDQDHDGTIDFGEFQALVQSIVKAPKGVEWGEQRTRYLWRAANKDGNGHLDFEEFVYFLRKYFEGSDCPFESYYTSIRRVTVP